LAVFDVPAVLFFAAFFAGGR